MHAASIVFQQPTESAERLIVLSHGVGSEPQSMQAVAAWFAQQEPRALIVSVASAHRSEIAAGWQWFSVVGVTEANRQARVDAAMPEFVAALAHWQAVAGLDATHTTIVGFSQGAIMALESSKLPTPPAAEVISLAGRFAKLPSQASTVVIHLLHGTADGVMPASLSQAAFAHLQQWPEQQASLMIVPQIGHQPSPMLLEHWHYRAD